MTIEASVSSFRIRSLLIFSILNHFGIAMAAANLEVGSQWHGEFAGWSETFREYLNPLPMGAGCKHLFLWPVTFLPLLICGAFLPKAWLNFVMVTALLMAGFTIGEVTVDSWSHDESSSEIFSLGYSISVASSVLWLFLVDRRSDRWRK